MKSGNTSTPRIEILKEKKLVGKCQQMSLIRNTTGQLWGSFAPRIKDIKNKVNNEKISMQIYDETYHARFNPANDFIKWATVEVTNFDIVLEGLDTFILPGGTYAVFDYQGSSEVSSFFEYIFRSWLPNSDFNLDHRPHFELLGEKYKNNDPDSEEEIWIPIKNKSI